MKIQLFDNPEPNLKNLLLTVAALLLFSCSSNEIRRVSPPEKSERLSSDLEKNIDRGKTDRTIRELSRNPKQVYAVNKKGESALHIAAKRGEVDILEALLEAGAKVNLQSKDGNTPLHLACYGNKEGAVSVLMEHGADPKIINSKKESAFHKAAVIGGEAIFNALYLKANLEGVNYLGRTPLHIASRYQNLEFCNSLLEAKVQESPLDFEGNDPLMACLKGLNSNQELESLLISKVSNIQFTNNKGESYMHEAATTDKVHAIALLLDRGAKVDSRDNVGVTPVVRALRNRKKNAGRALVENGADISVKDNDGRTLLHLMAFWMTEKTVLKDFIKAIDVNSIDNKGRSALHEVVYWGHLNNAKELIEAGAKVNILEKNGETPIFGAVRKQRLEMVDLLIASKADLKVKNIYGETPLKLAVTGEKHDMNIVRALLEAGAAVNSTNIYQESIAHEVIRSGNLELLQLLLKYKPKLSLKDRLGKTPLDWAVERNLTKIVELLKEQDK